MDSDPTCLKTQWIQVKSMPKEINAQQFHVESGATRHTANDPFKLVPPKAYKRN